MQEQDSIGQDQASLDAEQDAGAGPQYVSKGDYDALMSQVRGLQSALDRQTAQFNRFVSTQEQQRQEQESRRRLSEMEARLSQITDPDARAVAEFALEQARQQAPRPSPAQVPAQEDPLGLADLAKNLLQGIGIDAQLPGIDWSQDLTTSDGQQAFLRSAVEANNSALRQVMQRQHTPAQQPGTVNPPVEGAGTGSNGVIRSRDELEDAFINRRIDLSRYNQLRGQFR